MSVISINRGASALAALAALSLPATLSAQELTPLENTTEADGSITVVGTPPADLSGLPEGPDIEGIIAARSDERIRVVDTAGLDTMIALSEGTEIKGSGGFLGLSRSEITAASLLNGLPVKVETVEWAGGLVATEVKFKHDDFEVASMIHNGTAQRFAEHDVAIEENAAATEALRGRVANIDQYNIKDTTNVYFDTNRWNISASAQNELCAAASEAEALDNALLLVVGYTDSTGSQEYNQVLSERRAGGVVNYLQQQCGWEPWRMLTPTGMAEADPLADNTTDFGKAQNRRVAVNILVSKALDGM